MPLSTVHWWARNGVLVPSVSPERIKLWSYADLMGLRIIHWLRRDKTTADGHVPRSSMPAVREALDRLAALDLSLWTEDAGPRVVVDRAGTVLVTSAPSREGPHGQRQFDADEIDVVAPFSIGDARGPDLHSPRPLLQIVPGKLGGAPHVAHTRLESQALGALAVNGLAASKIYRLYPDVAPSAIDDALDLEADLSAAVAA